MTGLKLPCWCGHIFPPAEVIQHSGKKLECKCGMIHEVPELTEEQKKQSK